MIVLEKFQATHLRQIRVQPEITARIGHITEIHALALEAAPYAYTFMREGNVVACAGVAEYWSNRGEAWALLFTELRHDFVPITKMVKRFLDVCPLRRIEAAVVVDHAAGHRWTQLLGFQLEASLLRAYTPSGEDCSLYSRIRKGA